MHLVFFTHPSFLHSQSMPRFASMLTKGMVQRGHTVEIWSPRPQLYTLPVPAAFKKWLGYMDQYILFPGEVRRKLSKVPSETLFVFTDHALGPWIPLVKDRPHIIHCHDFLAQRSALGEIPENPTSKSGQQYQAFIRRGYQQGKNFISVSQKTKDDLHQFLKAAPHISEVVYNGMNQQIQKADISIARKKLGEQIMTDLVPGYILHVGGNQWYKNRSGVIDIYTAWRAYSKHILPLVMIGAAPSDALQKAKNKSPYKADIHFISGMNDEGVQLAYSGASLFLYPSLAEGFGWPIAEAMAAGCPVVTTGEAPMNEVGGQAAVYIPRTPYKEADSIGWAKQCANIVEHVINLDATQRNNIIQAGLKNVQRFNTSASLDKIESIYKQILLNKN